MMMMMMMMMIMVPRWRGNETVARMAMRVAALLFFCWKKRGVEANDGSSFVVCEYGFSRDECERNAFANDAADVETRTPSSSSFGTLGRVWPELNNESKSSTYHEMWCSKGTSGVTFSSKTKDYVTSIPSNVTTADVAFDAQSRASEAKAFSVEFWITPRLSKRDGFTGRHFTPFFSLETAKRNETFSAYTRTSIFDCADEFDFALYIWTDFSVGFRSREPIAMHPTLMAETCASMVTESNALIDDSLNHFVLMASFSDEANVLGENRISCYVNGTKIVDDVIGDVLVNDTGKRKLPLANAWRDTSAPYFGSTSANNKYDASDDAWEWTNTVHAFAMYDKKLSDEEILLNFRAGLPNAAPLVVDINVTIDEDVKETKIVLQYTDNDYYNATSTSNALNTTTTSTIKYSFSILSLPEKGVLKAVPIEDKTISNESGDGDNVMQTETAAIIVTHVPFQCFGNAVFYTPEPNDHSTINNNNNNNNNDDNNDNTLEVYANFTFKATETSLTNAFETIDSLNQGLVSIFVSPVNDAPLGTSQVVEYFGREEDKTFQIEFRDDVDEAEYVSKIEVSKLPTIGKVSLSSVSSESSKALNVGDVINVASEVETFTYRLHDDGDGFGEKANFDPAVVGSKGYLTDFFYYYAYDKYDEKSVNETKVEFRIQSPVRWVPPSYYSSVKETRENMPLEFTIDVLRLDCRENTTEAIVERLPAHGTVYLTQSLSVSTSSSSSVVAEEDRKTHLKENDVVRLEHMRRATITEEEWQEGVERCIAFAKVMFVPDDYYFNAPNVDIFGDAATLSTTKYVASPRSPLLSLSARDILDGWMVSSLSSPSSLSSLLLNVSFTVTADIPHAPAKFGNVSVDARAPPPSYLLRVDSNETNVNDSSSTFLLPNGGYLKFYDALEYDARPDYDTTFGVAVTIKSINPSGAAFFANVSIALPSEKEVVPFNTSSIVVTKWFRNQVKIAGPPSIVREVLFHYVMYDAKTIKNTPRIVNDTLELTLEYGFIKLYNAKKVNETMNAKYDWKHDSCRNQRTASGDTKSCTRIAHVDIEAIAYPSTIEYLTKDKTTDASNVVSQKSWFISGLFQGALAGAVLIGLWKCVFKKLFVALNRLFCCLFCCRLRAPPSAFERRRRRARKQEDEDEDDEDEEEDYDEESPQN